MKSESLKVCLWTSGLILLLAGFSAAPNDSSAGPKPKNCANLENDLELRKQTLNRMLSSLDSLLHSSKGAEVPIAVLFQVDLNKPSEVEKRRLQLARDQDSGVDQIKSEIEKSTCTGDSIKKMLESLAKLQLRVNSQRLEFLTLDSGKREVLLSAYSAQIQSTNDQSGLQLQLDSSKSELEAARSELAHSENQTTQSNGSPAEDLNIAKSALENYLVDLESENIRFIEALKSKKSDLDQLRGRLSLILGSTGTSTEEISKSYVESTGVWEDAVDRLLDLFTNVAPESNVKLPVEWVVTGEDGAGRLPEYLSLVEKAKARQSYLAQARIKTLNSLKVQSFSLLQDAGALRAKLLKECDLSRCDRPRGLNAKNVDIILREIRVVPLKFYAGTLSKWLEARSKASSGLDGWIDLTRQGFLLLVFILIPVALIRTFRWISRRLEAFRRSLLSKSMMDYRQRTNLAVWIGRLNPFVPSAGMILSIGVARAIVADTNLAELATFLFYFQVFFIYRMAKLFLKMILEVIFSTDQVADIRIQKNNIEHTATAISRLILGEFLILHLIQDTVRQGLAYHFFSVLIFWFNIFFIFYQSRIWRQQIEESFSGRFPETFGRLHSFVRSRSGIIVFPILFLSVAGHDLALFCWSYLSRIDSIKRLLSEVLRKRLESVEVESKLLSPPPQKYLDSFNLFVSADDEIFIDRENSALSNATSIIDSWLSGKTSDDLIVIVGDRGMGKTTTLDHVRTRFQPKTETILSGMPSRIINEIDLFSWMSKLLGKPVSKIEDVLTIDQTLTDRKVICVDEVQNCFLGIIGGFSAYRAFLEVISLKTSNIFWCLTINSRSWAFLKGVFGDEHFYGKVIELTPWKDFEIQKLILRRHEQTGFNRSFDKSIRTYGAGEGLGLKAESQFFRLLWGQSRGNPRSALMYWISAISSPGPNQIHVGVPSFIDSESVSSMSDSALFLLSAITRHENLTHDELRSVTGIEDTVIRKCIKEAHDKDLIWTDSKQKIRVSSRAQYIIDYFLTGKNFLYE